MRLFKAFEAQFMWFDKKHTYAFIIAKLGRHNEASTLVVEYNLILKLFLCITYEPLNHFL